MLGCLAPELQNAAIPRLAQLPKDEHMHIEINYFQTLL
jgi:hypothetical protein